MRKLWAWIESLFTKSEATTMADETVVDPTAAAGVQPAAAVEAPAQATLVTTVPVTPDPAPAVIISDTTVTVDLTVVENILIALGHDVSGVFKAAVDLASKKL